MFGDKLKKARKEKKIKQSDLAKALNVGNTTISNWENNVSKPDVDCIGLICGVLDVSPNYFFENSNNNTNSYNVSALEFEVIKKYRQLDHRGQQAVLDTLNREYSYIDNSSANIAALAVDALDTIDRIAEESAINQPTFICKK